MALRDVTNTIANYAVQIQMDKKYAPIIRKGRIIEEQASWSSFPARRAEGQIHIDLWVDSSLYPVNPATNCTSEFRTTKEYLEFLCHSQSRMLGYTKRLNCAWAESDSNLRCPRPIAESLWSSVRSLEEKVRAYETEIEQLQSQCNELHAEVVATIARHKEEREQLQSEVRALQSTCSELKALLTHSESSMETKSIEFQEEVQVLDASLQKCQADYGRLESKFKFMVETPLGLQQQIRGRMKSVHELARGSGNAKRRRTMIRAQLQPSIVKTMQMGNKLQGSRK